MHFGRFFFPLLSILHWAMASNGHLTVSVEGLSASSKTTKGSRTTLTMQQCTYDRPPIVSTVTRTLTETVTSTERYFTTLAVPAPFSLPLIGRESDHLVRTKSEQVCRELWLPNSPRRFRLEEI